MCNTTLYISGDIHTGDLVGVTVFVGVGDDFIGNGVSVGVIVGVLVGVGVLVLVGVTVLVGVEVGVGPTNPEVLVGVGVLV